MIIFFSPVTHISWNLGAQQRGAQSVCRLCDDNNKNACYKEGQFLAQHRSLTGENDGSSQRTATLADAELNFSRGSLPSLSFLFGVT